MTERVRDVEEFIHGTGLGDLPASVVAHARRCLLDLIGVGAAGSQTSMASIIGNHAAAHFGPGDRVAAMLFDGRPVSPVGAALAGGMSIDSFDAHDGHRLTKGHAGCGLLPALAALSVAEGMDDGDDFLASLVVGYEIAIRAGMALHRTASDYHTSGAWVAVACAAVGSRVLGLGAAPTAEALGIAEYHGPRSQMMRCIDHPTMVKDGSGWGAMAGVSAAYLAADGFTGAPALTVTSGDVADIWADLGSHWTILDQYFKPHPVCRWAQPAVEATIRLCADHEIEAEEVDHIEIVTFHEAARLGVRCPTTTEQAQYSLSFPVAAAVVRHQVSGAEISGAALTDPLILALSESAEITEDSAHNEAFPAARLARVTIVLRNGTRVGSADTEARGDPHIPLSDLEIQRKFHGLADPILGAERAAAVEAEVVAIGPTHGVDQLLSLIVAAPPARPPGLRQPGG